MQKDRAFMFIMSLLLVAVILTTVWIGLHHLMSSLHLPQPTQGDS